MQSEISNIIIEDEFIIIVTLDGDKRTIPIDNDNDTHKSFVQNIILMALSLVDETNPDSDMDMDTDGLYGPNATAYWFDGDDDGY
jgi:hypothetical protein